MRLLTDNLSPAQRDQLEVFDYFDVVGGDTGTRYRIRFGNLMTTARCGSTHEWTKRLASLAEALQPIPRQSVVLDAELCFPGADGAPEFGGLRTAFGTGQQGELTAILLHRDGVDLMPLQLRQRRRLLERLLVRANIPGLLLVPTFDDGVKLLEAAERHGLEGIVSKRQASPYRSGPSHDWVKTKTSGLASCEPGAVADVR
jgi:bifunctional non-homologous end joining protein LigD